MSKRLVIRNRIIGHRSIFDFEPEIERTSFLRFSIQGKERERETKRLYLRTGSKSDFQIHSANRPHHFSKSSLQTRLLQRYYTLMRYIYYCIYKHPERNANIIFSFIKLDSVFNSRFPNFHNLKMWERWPLQDSSDPLLIYIFKKNNWIGSWKRIRVPDRNKWE